MNPWVEVFLVARAHEKRVFQELPFYKKVWKRYLPRALAVLVVLMLAFLVVRGIGSFI